MNKIRSMVTTAVLCLAAMLHTNHAAAQLEKARQSMLNIYNAYDTMSNLSFDVEYVYLSDTLNGDFTVDRLKGSYRMNGKKAIYNLGDIEFMQNDSFLIAVYNKEKFMIVSDPPSAGAGSQLLPIRQQIDSFLSSSLAGYDVKVSSRKNLSDIAVTARDKMAQLNEFVISYNQANNRLISLQYTFYGLSDNYQRLLSDSTTMAAATSLRKKVLTIYFTNYHFEERPTEIYNENNFIVPDENIYKPSNRFSDFKVYYSRRKQ